MDNANKITCSGTGTLVEFTDKSFDNKGNRITKKSLVLKCNDGRRDIYVELFAYGKVADFASKISIGSSVTVSGVLNSNKWGDKYFTEAVCLYIKPNGNNTTKHEDTKQDDLPF